MPGRRGAVLLQPAIHGRITAAEVRPVMPVRIDPLDPDTIHKPAVFQPARSLIEPRSRPTRPAKTPTQQRLTTRRVTGPEVLHFAQKDAEESAGRPCACV